MARLPLWLKVVLLAIPGFLLAGFVVFLAVGWYVKSQIRPSGGELPASMAAYDVRHYDLELAVDPAERSIDGVLRVTVVALDGLDRFAIHLDDRLDVISTRVDGVDARFEHEGGIVSVDLPAAWRTGDRRRVELAYGGRPKTALRPPWIDGFVWSETPSGESWVGVTSEGDGGDNWWPCKDHPSDEPDEGMDIALTVPGDLVGLSNGRPLGQTANGDGTITSHWRVSSPINNYGVTVNIGPYLPVEATYNGVDGGLDEVVVFWAISESLGDARRMWPQIRELLTVMGRRFGEFPFFSDKLWVAQSPFLGMEHQTLIAYGGDFTDNEFGFDELLLHELAHEWWGNKITAADWGDIWLHEGFATYAEALFVLDTLGEARSLEYLQRLRSRITNVAPLVQGRNLTTFEAFSPDVYIKGAWVLHMLRQLVGDRAFFEILWRFADGDHPSACRLVTTADFTALAEEVSGVDLDWFWNRYLFTAELPEWRVRRTTGGERDLVELAWNDPAFEMPLPVQVGDVRRLIAMTGGRAELEVTSGVEVVVDPDGAMLATMR